MVIARGSLWGHVSIRCENVSGVFSQSGQLADSTAFGLKRLRLAYVGMRLTVACCRKVDRLLL